MQAFEERKARLFKDDRLPDWLRQGGERVRAIGQALQSTFSAVRQALLERAVAAGGLAVHLLGTLGFFVGRLENLLLTWELLLADADASEMPVARWVEFHEDAQGHCDYLVCAAPLSASDRLRELLWSRASSAVLMSATLTSCGSFDLFLRQVGLTDCQGLHLLQVASPFDYRSQAKLVIASMKTDPGNAPAHTEEVLERLPQLVHSRGTLMLFASARQMKAVYLRLDVSLQRITLMQGSMPKRELLARHRAAIDRGERSIIFGLQSMAEGVDLPREYCTHVIWTKLPFAVPDTPLEEARRRWLQSRGRSYFIEVAVPDAAIRFKQGLGRLIRTTEDRGTVTVLDPRLVTKRWGALLMRGIPDFQVVVEGEQPPQTLT